MQQQSNTVYETSKNAVINLAAINDKGKEANQFSGWIKDVKHGRIFVMTCAHNLFANHTKLPTFSYFAATIENATSDKEVINVGVSMRILGMDISADIAVLYSILPCEQTINEPFGFKFASKQAHLNFEQSRAAQSVRLVPGTPVYSISNVYDNGLIMTSGFLQDDDVIYNSLSPTYTNFTDQLITTIAVSDGSSGAPVLIYDHKSKSGAVIGMVAFTKNVDNFTGGPNVITLENVYKKLIKLNTNDFVLNCNVPTNFNGKTGKGYIGVSVYDVVDEYVLTSLTKKYQAFNDSTYRNKANGVVILGINNKDVTIKNSRIQNAIPYKYDSCSKKYKYDKCIKNGMQQFDIVLEVNGVTVGIYDNNASLNNAEYFHAGGKIMLKVLRPSTAEIIYFRVLCDEYPAYLEYVSTEPSIRLVGIFRTVGEKLGGFLGGYVDDYFGL
jgi:hypothetical protein